MPREPRYQQLENTMIPGKPEMMEEVPGRERAVVFAD
jgi:hypothetical protein